THRAGQAANQRSPRPAAPFGLRHLEVAGRKPDWRTRGGRPAAQDRVADRGGDVQGLLVTELPGAGGPGELPGLAGVPPVVVAGLAAEVEIAEDLAQRRVAEAAHRLGGELELPGVAGQVA